MEQVRHGQTPQTPEGQVGEARTYTGLQQHFLTRLERLVHLRELYRQHRGREDWLLRAINKAIYSTFMDCIAQGVGEEARAILQNARQGGV